MARGEGLRPSLNHGDAAADNPRLAESAQGLRRTRVAGKAGPPTPALLNLRRGRLWHAPILTTRAGAAPAQLLAAGDRRGEVLAEIYMLDP